MRITFWGVRGSTPTPARHTWRYGGNTPCVELRLPDQLVLIDAGTGIRELGQQLLAEARPDSAGAPPKPINVSLLFSHYHWDHIQGLPFFAPIYAPGNTVRLYGPRFRDVAGSSLSAALQALFCAPFFPVLATDLRAAHPIEEFDDNASFSLGDLRVRACRVNHPQGSVAYRFEHGGASVVYATDHEPGNEEIDRRLRNFARGADVLITDAQYFPEQLVAERKGWGHSSWQAATELARAAEVKNLILFHHEPTHSDEVLDAILVRARGAFANTHSATETLVVEVRRREVLFANRPARLSQRADVHLPVHVETTQDGARVREEAYLANLSFHGAYILSPHHFEPQQSIEIAVPLQPDPSAATAAHHGKGAPPGEFRLKGVVLRTEPQTTNGHWEGVAVIFPDAQGRVPAQPKAPPKPGPDSDTTS
ncbi:MAG TPA: MBL fold metallo-hydrolase [Candidatus Xenobia bacterium]|nr:MBL fold metallo-hydrolase [Candidatus Xenobia bacterium]